jgi:hypothetical protein
VKRREFVSLVGSAVGAWPLAARAQQPDRMRRIGVLIPHVQDSPVGRARITAFLQELEQFGFEPTAADPHRSDRVRGRRRSGRRGLCQEFCSGEGHGRRRAAAAPPGRAQSTRARDRSPGWSRRPCVLRARRATARSRSGPKACSPPPAASTSGPDSSSSPRKSTMSSERLWSGKRGSSIWGNDRGSDLLAGIQRSGARPR